MADSEESIKSYRVVLQEHESIIGFGYIKVFCGTKLTDATRLFADDKKTKPWRKY